MEHTAAEHSKQYAKRGGYTNGGGVVPEGFAGHEGGRGGEDEAPLDLGARRHIELPQNLVLQPDARHKPTERRADVGKKVGHILRPRTQDYRHHLPPFFSDSLVYTYVSPTCKHVYVLPYLVDGVLLLDLPAARRHAPLLGRAPHPRRVLLHCRHTPTSKCPISTSATPFFTIHTNIKTSYQHISNTFFYDTHQHQNLLSAHPAQFLAH